MKNKKYFYGSRIPLVLSLFGGIVQLLMTIAYVTKVDWIVAALIILFTVFWGGAVLLSYRHTKSPWLIVSEDTIRIRRFFKWRDYDVRNTTLLLSKVAFLLKAEGRTTFLHKSTYNQKYWKEIVDLLSQLNFREIERKKGIFLRKC